MIDAQMPEDDGVELKSDMAVDLAAVVKDIASSVVVQNVLGPETLKPFARLFGPLQVGALAFALMAFSMSAYQIGVMAGEVKAADDKVAEANVNLRQMWYWSQTAYSRFEPVLEAWGLHMDPPPKPTNMKPKEK